MCVLLFYQSHCGWTRSILVEIVFTWIGGCVEARSYRQWIVICDDVILCCMLSFHKLLSFGYFWTCTGLLRCGKSCRLRWTNYLRPEIKRGPFTTQEEKLVIQLHGILGNRSNIFSNSIQFNLFHSNSWMFLLSPSSDGQQLHLNSREEQTMRSRIYGTLISKSAWS